MSERVQQQKQHRRRESEQVEAPAPQAEAEELKASLDDIIDEIDELLVENAEEFVNSYVQRGGE